MADAAAISLDRMVRAVEKVRERLLQVTGLLHRAGIRYAVAGGNAVAAWVSTVDESAVRNTRDVDLLVSRQDLGQIRVLLETHGYVYRRAAGVDMFLDAASTGARDGVHLIFADEQVREGEPAPNPRIDEAVEASQFRVISLEALVRIKLTAFRDKDRTHIRDLIEVGLIDTTWVGKLPRDLAERLQGILDTPNG